MFIKIVIKIREKIRLITRSIRIILVLYSSILLIDRNILFGWSY